MRVVRVLIVLALSTRTISGQQQPIESVLVLPRWHATHQVRGDSIKLPTLQPNLAAPVIGGVGGGLMGMFVLGWAGYHVGGGGEICGDDPCGFAEGIYGALFGEILGVAAGVHVANRRLGSFGADLCASLLTLVVASAVFSGTNSDVAVPVALISQLGATVAVERFAAGRQP